LRTYFGCNATVSVLVQPGFQMPGKPNLDILGAHSGTKGVEGSGGERVGWRVTEIDLKGPPTHLPAKPNPLLIRALSWKGWEGTMTYLTGYAFRSAFGSPFPSWKERAQKGACQCTESETKTTRAIRGLSQGAHSSERSREYPRIRVVEFPSARFVAAQLWPEVTPAPQKFGRNCDDVMRRVWQPWG
jgi:hypothetical protein